MYFPWPSAQLRPWALVKYQVVEPSLQVLECLKAWLCLGKALKLSLSFLIWRMLRITVPASRAAGRMKWDDDNKFWADKCLINEYNIMDVSLQIISMHLLDQVAFSIKTAGCCIWALQFSGENQSRCREQTLPAGGPRTSSFLGGKAIWLKYSAIFARWSTVSDKCPVLRLTLVTSYDGNAIIWREEKNPWAQNI